MLNKVKSLFCKIKKVNLKDTIKTIKSCDVLLFCHDVDRSISLNNQAYSPLLDSIKDELEKNGLTCITIAHPWSEIIGELGYGSPIAINRSYFIATIMDNFPKRHESDNVLKLYKRIITKSKAKLIITIGCNDDLCEAARSLDIFHGELLHGIGYKPIPWNWNKKEKMHLPQCIFSLDEVSTQTFLELEKYGVIIKEIAHPFLKRFESKNIDNLPQEWLPPNKKDKYEKEILVSLQWGYTAGIDEFEDFEGFLSNGLFYDELEEVIRETNKKIFWHFRFHPVQYLQMNKYKQLFDFMDEFVQKHENCGWKESTYIPLPSVLSRCSGHITMSSMTTYEAAYLGISTLALCPSLRENGVYEEFFNDLVKKEYLIKRASNANFILDWVNNVEKMSPMLKEINSNFDIFNWLSYNILDNN